MKINNLMINKRLLSAFLALGISFGSVSALSEAHHMGNNIYMFDDKPNGYYMRYDAKTNTYNNISIFDDENVKSGQYGASQNDFDVNAGTLVEDSLIYAEMKKMYF